MVKLATWDTCMDFVDDITEISRFASTCISPVGRVLEPAYKLALAPVKVVEQISKFWSVRFQQRFVQPLFDKLPVLFTLHLIGMLYSCFVFCYMPAAGILLTSPLSILFHTFFCLIISSFAQVYTTDPGTVPTDHEWHTKGHPPTEAGPNVKWCHKSKSYKPDRSHYCRAQRRLVLRMDHHCPWLGNTIGFGNHKHFISFLTYTSITCILFSICSLHTLFSSILPRSSASFLFESFGLALLLASIMTPFCGFHMWLLKNNLTTVEYRESKCSTGEDGQSKYDVGIIRNLQQVLGDNPLLWFVPVGRPASAGLNFPSTDVCTSEELSNFNGNEQAENQELGSWNEWRAWADAICQGASLCCHCIHDASSDTFSRLFALCSGTRSASRTVGYSAHVRRRSRARESNKEDGMEAHPHHKVNLTDQMHQMSSFLVEARGEKDTWLASQTMGYPSKAHDIPPPTSSDACTSPCRSGGNEHVRVAQQFL